MIEMIEHMEEVINRELTPKEKRFVEWLSGWGTETIDIFNGLLDTFYKAGQADTLEQQQKEIEGHESWKAISEASGMAVLQLEKHNFELCQTILAHEKTIREQQREIEQLKTCPDCGGSGIVEYSHDPYYGERCICTVDWMQEITDRNKQLADKDEELLRLRIALSQIKYEYEETTDGNTIYRMYREACDALSPKEEEQTDVQDDR